MGEEFVPEEDDNDDEETLNEEEKNEKVDHKSEIEQLNVIKLQSFIFEIINLKIKIFACNILYNEILLVINMFQF